MGDRTFRDVLNELAADAQSTAEKGRRFENLVKAFLEFDKVQSARFSRVWLWADWPGNGGRHDTGIDLVAEERDGGGLVAIQCKFYGEDNSIALDQLNKFLTAYGAIQFARGILVATTDRWTRNAEATIRQSRNKPVERWGPDAFESSSIDWNAFNLDNPSGAVRRPTKSLRPYQQEALDAVIDGLNLGDRGKVILACGTGKTFIALRIAERQVGIGGTVLFLTPSISLLSQSLLDWANNADILLKTFAVCSDARAGQRRDEDVGDISPYDLAFPASTNVNRLMEHINRTDRAGCMTVIFSTYQSFDVISEAQQAGLPQFGLIICDEAHRTTGVSLLGQSESNFQRVHDDHFVAANKRLYMTATPRIYGDRAKRKANENRLTIASMENEDVYGPEFLVPYASDVSPVLVCRHGLVSRWIVVSLVQTQMPEAFSTTVRPLHHYALQSQRQQRGVVNIGSSHHQAQWPVAAVDQEAPLAARLTAVRRVGTDRIPQNGPCPWRSPQPATPIPQPPVPRTLRSTLTRLAQESPT